MILENLLFTALVIFSVLISLLCFMVWELIRLCHHITERLIDAGLIKVRHD